MHLNICSRPNKLTAFSGQKYLKDDAAFMITLSLNMEVHNNIYFGKSGFCAAFSCAVFFVYDTKAFV